MTPTEVKFAALRETRVVGLNETPAAEQGVLAQQEYEGLHAQLLADGLVTWSLTENIPAKLQQSIIWMLAARCAVVIGAADEDIQRLTVLGGYGLPQISTAERNLRKYQAAGYVSQPAQSEYF